MLEAPKQLGAQITANPAVLTDILAEEDRVKVNTSPNYEDDKMNVMLISGNFDDRKVLATPNSSKKTSYAGIAKKVRRSETFDPVAEVDDVLAVVPVLPSPVLPNGQATPCNITCHAMCHITCHVTFHITCNFTGHVTS